MAQRVSRPNVPQFILLLVVFSIVSSSSHIIFLNYYHDVYVAKLNISGSIFQASLDISAPSLMILSNPCHLELNNGTKVPLEGTFYDPTNKIPCTGSSSVCDCSKENNSSNSYCIFSYQKSLAVPVSDVIRIGSIERSAKFLSIFTASPKLFGEYKNHQIQGILGGGRSDGNSPVLPLGLNTSYGLCLGKTSSYINLLASEHGFFYPPLRHVPIAKGSNSSWVLNLNSINVGIQPLNFSGQVILESTMGLSYFSRALYDQVVKQLALQQVPPALFSGGCLSLSPEQVKRYPSIVFSFENGTSGTVEIELTSQGYLTNRRTPPECVILNIKPQSSNTPLVSLGMGFLSQYYTFFDGENNMVAFGVPNCSDAIVVGVQQPQDNVKFEFIVLGSVFGFLLVVLGLYIVVKKIRSKKRADYTSIE